MSDLSLNELSLDNIGSWPLFVKAGLIAFIFILILGLGYFLSFQEKYENITKLQEKEVELLITMERKQQLAANLPKYRAQLTEMKKRFGRLLMQLPGKAEIPELLEEISQKGLESGLKFQLFDPQTEIPHDFYTELPISIIVDGEFPQIAKFISKIAGMRRIVTMHDFKLYFPDPKGADNKKPIRLINGRLPLFLSITAKVYRYQTEE